MKTLLLHFGLFSIAVLNAQNSAYLEINEVKALISNYNSMHWDMMGGGDARYEVPKGTSTIPGPNAGFASALWIGGYDIANQLHLAAQTYRQGGDDFWAGPLDTINATTNSSTILQYNRLWKLNKTDINNFISNYANGSVGSGAFTPVADLLSWPANGSGTYAKKLAPYVDANNNGIYDPMTGGDYPKIKGDQAIYYIINDNGAIHQNSGGLPLGVEIHAMAYAYGPGIETSYFPQLAYTTFYNYKLINRSNKDYHNVYISMWDDVDIGYYGDDFIGCNVGENYGYAYNAAQNDPTSGSTIGYGNNPPASGHQIVKGPYADANDNLDNDNDGTTDELCEQNLMNVFNYFNNSFAGVPANNTDPDNAAQFYNYMSGYWRDGTPFTCGGNAYGGSTSTKFVYPGTTYTTGVCGATPWNEVGMGGDRRYILSAGPFSLDSKEIEEIEYALVTSFDPSTHNPVNKLKYDMNAIKVFSNNFDSFAACNTTLTNTSEIDIFKNLSIYPNPANDNLSIDSEQALISSIEILDAIGNIVLSSKIDNSINLNLKVYHLPSGLYFLRITSEGKSSVKKFVKE